MKAVHLRIRENMHLNNVDFVDGCADRFQFGDSEIVRERKAPEIVASYFRGAMYEGVEEGGQRRQVVLVGHDVKNDVKMLQRLGYNVNNNQGLITLDTGIIHRAYKGLWNPSKLAYVLDELGIEPWFLHNAGNDAVYTLQALIGLAVRSASERGQNKEEDAKAAKEELRMKEVEEALQAVIDAEKKQKAVKKGEYVAGLFGSEGGDSDRGDGDDDDGDVGFEVQDSGETRRVATSWTQPALGW